MKSQVVYISKVAAIFICFYANGLSMSYAKELTHMNSTAKTHITLAYDAIECPNLGISATTVTLGEKKKDGSFKRDGDGNCLPYKLPQDSALVITDVSFVIVGESTQLLRAFTLTVDKGEIGGANRFADSIFLGVANIIDDLGVAFGNASILGGRVVYSPGSALQADSESSTSLTGVFITGYHVLY